MLFWALRPSTELRSVTKHRKDLGVSVCMNAWIYEKDKINKNMCGVPQWLAQLPPDRKVSLGFESRPGTLSNSDEKKRKDNLRPIMSQCG